MWLTIHDSVESLSSLAAEWNDLLRRSYSNRIFSTYEWQMTWWEAYHPGELWIAACRTQEGRLIGIAPWFIEVRPDERVVRSIGCVDVTDYVDLIIDVEFQAPVLALFAAFLAEHRDRYDRINLCNIPEHSPTLVDFTGMLSDCGFSVEPGLQEVCPGIRLPKSWDAYLDGLDKKQRHEIRRKLRRAEGGEETLTWYFVGSQHDLDEELDHFLTLMAASQPAKAQFLANTANATFLRQIAHVTFDRGWLQLSFLMINGIRCAAYFNFDYGDAVQVYNSGLNPDLYSHLSTGIVLLAYNIRHAIESGHTYLDFLRGNEEYKYRMGGQDTRIFMLKAH